MACLSAILAKGLAALGCKVVNPHSFDTVTVDAGAACDAIAQRALAAGANLRRVSPALLGINGAELAAAVKKKWHAVDFVVHSIAYANPDELKASFRDTSREGFRVALDLDGRGEGR